MVTPPDDSRVDFSEEVEPTPLPDGGDMPVYNLVSAEFELPDEEVVAGRFELLERIARGGMGSIYRGRDRALNRTVAVKVLRNKFLDRPDLLRRFMDEAQINAKLQHPGVVPVYEVGTLNDGRPFIAMKLIEGMTLAKLLDERANPKENLGHFLKVFESLCQTISFAHSQGVIHRDLKPDNVMVGAFGEVLVMDWGLAKSLDEKLPKLSWGSSLDVSEFASADGSVFAAEGRTTEAVNCQPISLNEIHIDDKDTSGLTNPGEMFGTMRYMPPEQARADRKRMDRRSDVFALGGILCEVLTGQPPYSGTTDAMREQARTANLTIAYQNLDRCGADPALVMLVKHCLAVNPDDRPTDGAALADLLSEFLEGMQARNRAMEVERFAAQTELSHAEYRADRAQRDQRRSRLMAVLSAFIGVGVAVLFLWYAFERNAGKPKAQPVAVAPVANLDDALQATDDAYQLSRTHHSDIDRWLTASYNLERATQRQAEVLESHTDATPEQRDRATKLHQQATDEIRAARLTVAIAKQPVALFDARDGHFDAPRAAKQCADTFSRNSFDILSMTPASAATFVNEHPAADRLTARLTDWLALTPDTAERKHLHATLDKVTTPTRVRSTWLNALANVDAKALTQLVASDANASLPPAALVAIARTLEEAKQPAAAEQLLQQGVRRHPGDFAINAALGQRLQANPEKRATALRYLAAAVAAEPTFIPARLDLAKTLADAGQAEEGLDILRETQRAEPKVASVPFRIGQIMEARGAKNEAVKAYKAAANADPSFAPAQVRLGQYALDANNLTEAEQAFRAAIAFTPDDKPARTGLAMVLLRKGHIDQAIAQLDPSMQLQNLDAKTLHLLVAGLRKGHREHEALTLLRTHTGKPMTPELQHEIGMLLLFQNDPAALTNLKSASELLPKSAEVRGNYADALAQFGKFRTAAMTYRQAADLLPEASPQRETLTANARQMTRFAGLETHVQRITPSDLQYLSAPSLAELGDVCQRTQRFASAAKFYTLAAKTESRHREAAALNAAYAGFGFGIETATTAERKTLRQQALADFTAVGTKLPPTSPLVVVLVAPRTLVNLTPTERASWEALFANFAAPRTRQ